MTKPSLIPFKAEHLMMFIDRDGLFYNMKDAIHKENDGPAFTAVLGDKILGCAGIILQWQGVGTAWVVFNKDIEHYMLWATRTIKYTLRDIKRALNLHRIDMTVLEGLPKYNRWAEFLGFCIEDGRASKLTYDKQNCIRYEMVD